MNLDEAIAGLERLVAEVRRASLTDDKTRLGSALSLRQEARSINEGKGEFDVVVFGDLNDFKHLNDVYGHEAGDVAINKVGEVLYHLFVEGKQGKAFRKSGDEFVILLKQDQLTDVTSLAISLSSVGFEYNGKPLSTGLSIGYVVSDGKTGFEDLLVRAELACSVRKPVATANNGRPEFRLIR